jgi:hypothetical protein
MASLPWRKIALRDIQNVVAAGVAIINCPKGANYKKIGLIIGNTAAGNGNAPTATSVIANVQIILGNGIQRDVSGADLDLINTAMSNGRDQSTQAVVTGGANGTGRSVVPIFFDETFREEPGISAAFGWPTDYLGANDVFQIKVTLQGGITPALSAYAIVDDNVNGKARPIVKWYSQSSNTNDTTLELSNIVQGAAPSDRLLQISFMDTSDGKQVTTVRAILNGQLVLDDLASTENNALLKNLGALPAAGAFHWMFDGFVSLNAGPLVSEIGSSSVKLTFSAASAGTLRRVTQRLGMPA